MPFLLIGYTLDVKKRYVEKRRVVIQMVLKLRMTGFNKDVEFRVLHGESGGMWRCICDIQRG